MTDTATIEHTTYYKGVLVTALRQFTGSVDGGWNNSTRRVPEGTTGTVTSVRSSTRVRVRFTGIDLVVTANVTDIALQDNDEQNAARAARAQREEDEKAKRVAAEAAKKAEAKRLRDLAKPKDGDILPDDPRIAWLWAKIEQDPEVKRYCHVYDQIADKVGIPGRVRTFQTSFDLNGAKGLNANIEARSAVEAGQSVLDKFTGATDIHVNGTKWKPAAKVGATDDEND